MFLIAKIDGNDDGNMMEWRGNLQGDPPNKKWGCLHMSTPDHPLTLVSRYIRNHSDTVILN